jgi:diguanylate cyclase (GGDEF)-like protein/PAS domain S-box-containing protein
MTLRTLRNAYLLGIAVLACGYVLVRLVRPAIPAVVAGLTVAIIAVGLVRMRPRRWLGWVLLGLAVATMMGGQVTFAVVGQLGPPEKTYPAPNELAHLATTALLTAALILLGRPALRSRDVGMLLDIAVISLTNALVVWLALLRPAIANQHLSTYARVITFANIVGAMLVVAAAFRVILSWYRVSSLRWLGVGALAFISGGAIYAGQLQHGKVVAGGASDVLFLVFAACAGAAALSPSMARIWSDPRPNRRIGPFGVVGLMLAALIAPAALLFEARLSPVTTDLSLSAIFVALGGAAVIRLALSINAHRSRLGRTDVIRLAARELSASSTQDEVLAAVTAALGSALGPDVHCGASIVDGVAERSMVGDELLLPVDTDGRGLKLTAPAADLVELAPVLEAIADHAASALDRIALAERLSARESERYFRSLVLTSRDVTMISRGGRVVYATPLAADMFGGDVRGRLLDELVLTREATGRLPSEADEFEGRVRRPDGVTLLVLVRQRDLSDDPHVIGVVTTVRDVTDECTKQMELAYRANHDPLTGLANRHAFDAALRSGPADRPRAVLFIDLDDFKLINDTYGHRLGDQVLAAVAQRIESCLRAGDIAARVGGDEFAVLLNDAPDEYVARTVAQRIVEVLSATVVIEEIRLRCQASVGLSFGLSAAEHQLHEADLALYAAKAAGKGRWSQYQHGMSAPAGRHAAAPED